MDPESQERIQHSLDRLPQGEFNVMTVVNWAYAMVGMVAVGFIVYGAIQYANAHGDPGKAKRGKDTITFSVIGLVIVILAAVITNFVIGVFT